MLTYWEILTAIQSDIPIYDSYAKLWGEKLSNAYTTTTYTGTLPAVLTGTKAGYLHSYKIYGNLEQTGTPTPENPIVPQECGELETTGAHAGQYKLSLTSAGQNVNIYLGESQTTRQIKKLVLTGQETPASITQTTDGNNYCVVYKYSDLGMTDIKDYDKYTYLCPYPVFVSSHFTMKSIEDLPLSNSYNDIQPGQVGGNTWITRVAGTPTYNRYIIFCVSGITTINDFKAYLAAQYTNGTPVTVWYILETEQTGTLNEPLRKIGNYADTIDSTQTSAQIPTSAGSTTISWAGEGISPSQVEFIYKAKR